MPASLMVLAMVALIAMAVYRDARAPRPPFSASSLDKYRMAMSRCSYTYVFLTEHQACAGGDG